jgi:small subunit ribosomal protein S11
MGKKRIIVKGEEGSAKENVNTDSGVTLKVKKGVSHKIQEGRIYIYSSYNNTIMSLTDDKGNVIINISAGSIGFKGTKKSTPFAASKVADALSDVCNKLALNKVKVFVKGIGAGRESALRSLAAKGLDIISIKDITPVPHNGCRPPKVRRV